ncbi:CYH3 protein, partial [Polypterus senegalus]
MREELWTSALPPHPEVLAEGKLGTPGVLLGAQPALPPYQEVPAEVHREATGPRLGEHKRGRLPPFYSWSRVGEDRGRWRGVEVVRRRGIIVKGPGLEVPDDLSLEEREELLNIRRRKKELMDDIERLKFEIAEVMTEIEHLTCVGESKTSQRNKQIAMGRKKFNMDPKKGIQFLLENDLLQNTPEDIAQFLYKGEGLNKTVIGDYLGERDDFNIKVLQAFVELHEFADLNLVQALSLTKQNNLMEYNTVKWGRVKTWKRRWFILTDNCLYYFEYTTDKEPRGIIPLENLSIREVEDPRKPNCFELHNPNHKGQVIKACKTEADGRVVEGNHVVYRISAPTPDEKEEWIKSIKSIEVITIDQRTVTYRVVSMPIDAACLFHSLCYILHGHIRLTLDIRRNIVSYVLNDWDRFKVWTDDGTGDN